MKISTAPCNWNNGDIPDFRPYTPYAQMMDEMVEAGYTATEWGPGMPDDPAVVRDETAKRGLEMVGAFVRLGYRDRDKWDEADAAALAVAERVKAAGGSILVAAELGDERRDAEAGHVDEANGLSDEQWRNLADGLSHLADLLEPMGMRVVLHNHVGTYVETAAETRRFLDETDPAKVGWCLDVGHLKYGGGDAMDFLPTYGDRVEHVHLKDVDPEVLRKAKAEQWSFGDALRGIIFPELGDGLVDIKGVVSWLQEHDYNGWVVLEQDTTHRAPKDAARINREYVQSIL
ncbi:TIM barrel protein [Gephyromycinifex aptenodytis]|uniref:TIM barrel protein n=1 Tax=Gephyromycinifex aptenodytis TaxID=2716227 RepID=UPI0014477779|nr:TIM barrel protein [Gephyromycinifex aptenodytis]